MLSNISAEIRYVDKKGSNTPPYLSWQTAAIKIQDAVNYSGFGDTIFVANGFYIEKINMKPEISLIGGGIDSCIIDPHMPIFAAAQRPICRTNIIPNLIFAAAQRHIYITYILEGSFSELRN